MLKSFFMKNRRLKRTHSGDIESARGALLKAYAKYSNLGIVSLYLWGSIMREDYVCGKSDVDVMAIVSDSFSEKSKGKVTRTIRAAAPWLDEFNVSFVHIGELQGGRLRSMITALFPPPVLLFTFGKWEAIAGRTFDRNDFSVSSYTDEQMIGFYKWTPFKTFILKSALAEGQGEFAVKQCVYLCHFLHRKASGDHPCEVKTLLRHAIPETKQIIPIILSLKESPDQGASLQTQLPALLRFIESVKASYPNGHLDVFFKEVLPGLTEKGIDYWVVGGVAVAGVAGAFIRENKDVDVCVRESDFNAVHAYLSTLCQSRGESWRSHYSFDRSAQRGKIEIYVNGIQRFSVDSLHESADRVEFLIMGNKKVVFNERLVREERAIGDMRFFTAQRSIIAGILRHVMNDLSHHSPVKLFENTAAESRYWVDAMVLLGKEEYEAIYKKAEREVPKVFKRKMDTCIGFIGIFIRRISPAMYSFLKSHLKAAEA